jgi:hypothetical protein
VLGGAGSADPTALIDPGVHGALLAAVAAGSPLDRLGQSRLTALKEAGLVTADGRPRFPVAPASQAKAVRAAAADLGGSIARLVAGEWSRLEVEYEPVRAALAGPGGPTAAFLVVGGLLLDLGVRRLLRRQGLAAPPFGGAYVWLAEGEPGAAGSWTARSTALPGRGSLVRFGRRESPAWDTVAADPEAAPALPAAREPQLRELIEGLGWSVVRLVEDAIPGLDPLRRRTPGADDEGAFLAWAYALALDVALERLAARGLVAPPAAGVVAVRVADPALAGA